MADAIEKPSLTVVRKCYNINVERTTRDPIDWELVWGNPNPPRNRLTFLHDSKQDVLQEYWSYSNKGTACFASCAPLWGAFLGFVYSFEPDQGFCRVREEGEARPFFI